LPKIDLILAGSPCQGFSFAGKQLAFDDPRSKLFFDFVDIKNHYKPDYYLLENVKMKQVFQDVISKAVGNHPYEINSSLVSAQNRRRDYWSNLHFTEPEDKRIILKDILEFGAVDRDKSYCLDANYFKGTNLGQYLAKSRRQIVFHENPNEPIEVGHAADINGHDILKRVYSKHGKSPTLTAICGGNQHKKVAVTEPMALTERRTEEAKRIRREFQQKFGRDFSPRRAKELVPREDGKMNCLTATYSLKEHILIDEKLYYRKLTPIECERLQTVPDNYTEGVSNTQRYKMLGNGWTVDVIAHILKGLI
jgi:DNA-cytosine methyltransferase